MADEKKFLADLQSKDAATRFAAWRGAGEMSPAVIPELGKLAAGADPGVAKAAREALKTMTHSVGEDPAAANRAGVVKGLLALAAGGDMPVRVHALRLLSNIAGADSVPAIAKLIPNADLFEEAVYCLEQIPGDASVNALIAAYPAAADARKVRLLGAFGHRRAAAALNVCLEAMKSANAEVAIAGMKAAGRVGEKPPMHPPMPDPANLTEWQKIEAMDSLLRYADARRAANDTGEAMRVYQMALNRPEEHWQCAAIVGLAKIGTADAAAQILLKMKSDNPKVRITAQNTWKGMATNL